MQWELKASCGGPDLDTESLYWVFRWDKNNLTIAALFFFSCNYLVHTNPIVTQLGTGSNNY